jgi:hypothetical protein
VRLVVVDDGAAGHGTYFQPRAWRSVAATVVAAPPAVEADDPADADAG